MKEYIIELGKFVYEEVKGQKGTLKNRLVNGYSPGGDAQFNIDAAAENAVLEYVKSKKKRVSRVIYRRWRSKDIWRQSSVYFDR